MSFDRIVRGTTLGDDLYDQPILPGERVLMLGRDGNDIIYSSGPRNSVLGGNGNDQIFTQGGVVFDGAGNDTVTAEISVDLFISGGNGDDDYFFYGVAGTAASFSIYDSEGSDDYYIRANGGKVMLKADVLDSAAADTFVVIGASSATLSYAATTKGVTVSLDGSAWGAEIGADGFAEIGVDGFHGFTRAIGGSGNDTMMTDRTSGQLFGGAGDDELTGLAGDDILNGGEGWDNIYDYGGVAHINTGNGDDNVIISVTGGHIILGDGLNLLELRNDTVRSNGIYEVVLNSLGNTIVGTDEAETFVLRGEGIATVELGQNGSAITGSSFHTIHGSNITFDETLKLTGLQDFTVTLESDQYLGIDRVVTGSGNDFLGGSATAFNAFATGSGDDEIVCRATITEISAGRGNDLVHGGDGVATIDMGPGIDRVFCGMGAEAVSFNLKDTIGREQLYVFDFEMGTDHIALDPGADAAAFLALGQDVTISDMSGVRFQLADNEFLFIGGLTAADLTLGLFV